jgi:hypothetical protein
MAFGNVYKETVPERSSGKEVENGALEMKANDGQARGVVAPMSEVDCPDGQQPK